MKNYIYQKCQDDENRVWFQKIPVCESKLKKKSPWDCREVKRIGHCRANLCLSSVCVLA